MIKPVRFSSLFIILFMVGCTTTGIYLSPPLNQYLTWKQREQKINDSMQTWQAKGALGLRSDNEGFNASFDWIQTDNGYTLKIYSPLSSQQAILKKNDKFVRLQLSSGEHYFALTPEELVKQHFGWDLPVSNLYYWLRGLPAPDNQAEKEFDAYNHITKLKQGNWNVHYTAYTNVNGVDLPRRITLNNPELRVRLVLRQWEINTPELAAEETEPDNSMHENEITTLTTFEVDEAHLESET